MEPTPLVFCAQQGPLPPALKASFPLNAAHKKALHSHKLLHEDTPEEVCAVLFERFATHCRRYQKHGFFASATKKALARVAAEQSHYTQAQELGLEPLDIIKAAIYRRDVKKAIVLFEKHNCPAVMLIKPLAKAGFFNEAERLLALHYEKLGANYQVGDPRVCLMSLVHHYSIVTQAAKRKQWTVVDAQLKHIEAAFLLSAQGRHSYLPSLYAQALFWALVYREYERVLPLYTAFKKTTGHYHRLKAHHYVWPYRVAWACAGHEHAVAQEIHKHYAGLLNKALRVEQTPEVLKALFDSACKLGQRKHARYFRKKLAGHSRIGDLVSIALVKAKLKEMDSILNPGC